MKFWHLGVIYLCFLVGQLAVPDHSRGQNLVYFTAIWTYSTTLQADQVALIGPRAEDNAIHNFTCIEFDPTLNRIYGVDGFFNKVVFMDLGTRQYGTAATLTGDLFRPLRNDRQRAVGLTRDPVTGKFYFATQNYLFRLNIRNGDTTLVGNFSGETPQGDSVSSVSDIAIDNNGDLYAVSRDMLWQLSKNDATLTFVGSFDYVDPDDSGAMSVDFDPDTGRLYVLASPQSTGFDYTNGSYGYFDISTGEFVLLTSGQGFSWDIPYSMNAEMAIADDGQVYVVGMPNYFTSLAHGHFSSFPIEDVTSIETYFTTNWSRPQAIEFSADGSRLFAVISREEGHLGTIDSRTGSFSWIGPIVGDIDLQYTGATGSVSYDPTTDTIFVATRRALFTVDEFGQSTLSAHFQRGDADSMRAIDFNAAGELFGIGYGLDTEIFELHQIDQNTGEFIQSHELTGDDIPARISDVGMDFHPETDVLYASLKRHSGHEIIRSYGTLNIKTGAFTKIADGLHAVFSIRPGVPDPDVFPTDFVMTSGEHSGGFFHYVETSNDLDYVLRSGQSQILQRVELELEGVSQVSNPSSMEITVESSAFFRSPPTQKIELFDYVSNGFVEVDTRNASPFDSVVTVSPAGSIERFIQPSTGLVKARLSYRQPTGRSSGFSVGIDHVFWHIE